MERLLQETGAESVGNCGALGTGQWGEAAEQRKEGKKPERIRKWKSNENTGWIAMERGLYICSWPAFP